MFVSKAFAATAEPGATGGVFPPFDPASFASQLLWLAITFGIFYMLMSRIVIPRISGILEVRRDRISRDLDEAQRLRDEADAAHAAYEQELAEARSRAHKIAQEARDVAKAEADAKRGAKEAELNQKLAESEKRIAAIKAQAMGEVDRIASDTASTIIGELLGATAAKTEINKAIAARKG